MNDAFTPKWITLPVAAAVALSACHTSRAASHASSSTAGSSASSSTGSSGSSSSGSSSSGSSVPPGDLVLIVGTVGLLLDGGVARNVEQYPGEAWVPAVDGGYYAIRAAIQDDGGQLISGLPPGPIITFAGQFYTQTEAGKTIPFLNVVSGRLDTVGVTGAVPITIQLDGLDGVTADYDELVQLVAPNDNVLDSDFLGAVIAPDGGLGYAVTALPDGGTTATLDGTANWEFLEAPNGGPTVVVSPSDGDSLFISALTETPSGVWALDRFLDLTGTSLGGTGATDALRGTLARVPATATFSLSVSVPDTFVGDLAPGTQVSSDVLSVVAQPGTAAQAQAYGVLGANPDVLTANGPIYTTAATFTAAYGNPYPSTWPVFVELDQPYYVNLALPADGGTLATIEGWYYADSIANLSATYEPQISPARSLTLNGASWPSSGSELLPIGHAGLSPTLAWSPPTSGTVTNYEVDLYQVVPASEPSEMLVAFIELPATATRLVIPPGPLQVPTTGPELSYFAEVTAIDMPGLDTTVAPGLSSFPLERVSTASGVFSP